MTTNRIAPSVTKEISLRLGNFFVKKGFTFTLGQPVNYYLRGDKNVYNW